MLQRCIVGSEEQETFLVITNNTYNSITAIVSFQLTVNKLAHLA